MAQVSASTQGKDTAGVPFPPPLAFIGALGLGFALEYLLPVRILRSATGIDVLEWIGAGLVLAAIALAICAFTCFHLAHTSPFPERPTTSLIIRGPFRYTRNPLYLAMTLVHAGVALFANALWPLLFLVPAVLAIHFLVIAREEPYLLKRFGPEYEAYCRSVRRWL
jgi:protein-S-isoprenylcysteine O-methyltransferase Ste14